MSDWHIGQLVVCVDDTRPPERPAWEVMPARGCVYTIRDIAIRPSGPCFLLDEVVNKAWTYVSSVSGDPTFCEVRFRARRFRPVRKTSIEVFTAMLNKVPEMEDA